MTKECEEHWDDLIEIETQFGSEFIPVPSETTIMGKNIHAALRSLAERIQTHKNSEKIQKDMEADIL